MRYDALVVAEGESKHRRSGDTHPLWLRVFVGILGGSVLGVVSMGVGGDALGMPIAIVVALLLMTLTVSAMVKSKKVWSVFRIFEGL